MNTRTVFIAVTFLVVATFALAANLPSDPTVGEPSSDPTNRDAKHILPSSSAVNNEVPDDLKADGFFLGGFYGGWPYYGGWGGRYGWGSGWGGRYGGWGWNWGGRYGGWYGW